MWQAVEGQAAAYRLKAQLTADHVAHAQRAAKLKVLPLGAVA